MESWPVATTCHTGAKDMIWILELGPEAVIKCVTVCERREVGILDPSQAGLFF